MQIPVRFVRVPKNVVLTSGDEDTLRFTVRDKGISLVTYFYKKEQQPVEIDFTRYANSAGTGVVPAADLLRLANTRLPASAKAISVKPEQVLFYYNNGEKKIVPVHYQGKVEPDMLYFISAVTYSTDSVTIYASEDKLDSISTAYTEPIANRGFRDSLTINARLQPIEGVKMVPNQVTIHFQTDMLTEGTIDDIPVVGINMPEGKVLRTFPAKLAVSFVTGMKNYQTMQPSDFLIVADYNELAADSTARCNVYLRRQPDGIQRVRMATEQVDYIIEEHTAAYGLNDK